MTWAYQACFSKVTGGSLVFSDKCVLLGSLLVTFLGVLKFILSRSFWLYQWCRNQSFDTPKLWLQHYMYYCQINVDETNLTISKKITNCNSSGHICHLKMASGLFAFVDKCNSFKSLLVIFFSIIRFVLLKYFWRY
jgi:hypothetical protein